MIKKLHKSGVTAAAGVQAAGIHAGFKKRKKDMALLYFPDGATVAGVFTKNKVKAAPVQYDQQALQQHDRFKAILINSGNANACTGKQGKADVEETVKLLAAELDIQPEEVLVSSTGVIGMFMNMDTMRKGVQAIAPEVSEFGGAAASKAIMTTDTVPKEVSFTFEVAGKTATIGGMVKGSGMIHPNLGTMLGYITTDVAISQTALHAMLLKAADATFNHATIDGDTSTNDSVFVAATGKLDNPLIVSAEDAGYAEVEAAVLSICSQLAQLLVKDGEGATKFVEVLVSGAKTMADAVSIGKSVATSSLVKTAMFGEDANWGRVITAAGYADTEYFDADVIDIAFSSKNGEIKLCEAGMGVVFDEELAKKILEADEINILIDLHLGTEAASTWTCDFSYDYVKINADYRS